MRMRYWLVMPAAGAGRRFGERLPKQYAQLRGRAVIEWALAPFLDDPRCASVTVALAATDAHWGDVAHRLGSVAKVTGGAERSESVRNALRALGNVAAAQDWVLVHDAARPCLPRSDLDHLISQLVSHSLGGLLAAPAADTLKHAATDQTVERTVDRAGMWRALTPQMFRYGPLCEALDRAHARGRHPSDEAQAMEWMGERPLLVRGSPFNIKITTAEDLAVAEALLAVQARPATGDPIERSGQ